MMERAQTAPERARHAPVCYALLAQPRPGNRETRMREILGAWQQRNAGKNGRQQG